MIGLLMRDMVLAFCIWPPRRRLDVTLGIGVVGLLFRLDELDKSLGHHLAR